MTISPAKLSIGLALVLAVMGCGKSGETPNASLPAPSVDLQPAATTTAASTTAAKGEEPAAVVTSFLESLRAGNDTVAAALLTQRAREETQRMGLKVQPPGTPDMTYQIGLTEFVTEEKDGAHVGSIWTEKFEDGSTESFEVIWVLRLESQGWRIVGMATPVGENYEPLFLNFEDPEDLLRKWQATEEEMAGTAEPGQNSGEYEIPQNADKDFGGNPLR